MGTMFLGIFYLLLDLLAVTMIATVAIFPDRVLHEAGTIYGQLGIEGSQNVTVASSNGSFWMIKNSFDCDNTLFGLFVTIGCTMLTISLLYGVITGRPRYLLPFFCLQVFDFCATSFTFVSYFSFQPDIKTWIAAQKLFPLRDQLLSMSTDWLLILCALMAVTVLWTKGYCIIIVWSCYKYLVRSEASPAERAVDLHRSSSTYDTQEQVDGLSPVQVVLPPKYEDIMHIPILAPSPPPYVLVEAEVTDQDWRSSQTNNNM